MVRLPIPGSSSSSSSLRWTALLLFMLLLLHLNDGSVSDEEEQQDGIGTVEEVDLVGHPGLRGSSSSNLMDVVAGMNGEDDMDDEDRDLKKKKKKKKPKKKTKVKQRQQSCPEPALTRCTKELRRVTCGGSCEYSNPCLAVAAGYTQSDCTRPPWGGFP